MSPYWVWLVLTLGIQFVAPRANPKGYQRGKFITMPMRRSIRFFDTLHCRTKQLFLVCIPADIIGHILIGNMMSYIYFGSIIALYLDDWITNHDDFKRFGDWVRNKIKWKMELPQPATDKVAS